jgi:hypothetical protein
MRRMHIEFAGRVGARWRRLSQPVGRICGRPMRWAVRRMIRRRMRVGYLALVVFPFALAAVPLSLTVVGDVMLWGGTFNDILNTARWGSALLLVSLDAWLVIRRAIRRRWMRVSGRSLD